VKEHEPNRAWWDEVTPVHARSAFYNVEGFLRGADVLDEIERGGVGEVAGKSLLHLQCHFGLGTLHWARLGAQAVGIDFSGTAISQAKALTHRARLHERARFLQCDVLELDRHLSETFDIVFTSYGVITWLKDLTRWGRIIARFLKPGGKFFMVEIHPAAMMLEGSEQGIRVAYDYFHDPAGIELSGEPDYADPSYTPRHATREWQWSLMDVFQALEGAGLAVSDFREYPFSCFRHFPAMEQRADGHWHLPAGQPRIPLLFSLSATHS